MNWAQLCALGLRLPEVVEDIWFRTPALKVRGKSFVRLKEDGQSVVFLLESVDEQEFLIETQPQIYFITDHYRGWPAVLARLSELRVAEARLRLLRAFNLKAPKSLRQPLEAQPAANAKPKKASAPRAKSQRGARAGSRRSVRGSSGRGGTRRRLD